MGSSARLVLAGALVGVAAAVASMRLVEAWLFGVAPTDPATYVLVTIAVVATAALATWRPVRQATSVDPLITLQEK